MNKDYKILLFYKYTHIDNPEELCQKQRNICEKLGIKGRIIIAEEGINTTCEGTKEAIEKYLESYLSDPRFADTHIKRSVGTGSAFPKLSVRVRSEIVSGHLGDEDIHPSEITGKRVTPDELKKWYEKQDDFVVIDMRNEYEYRSGHFENSVNSGMKNFRDLRRTEEQLRDKLKDKKVVTVCTGGVRCEKASGYLKEKGWKDVYQLDGGIVSYIEKYPADKFKGSLYVFDDRITMTFDPEENHEVVGKCMHCDSSCETYVNCVNLGCHYHFICCDSCLTSEREAYCGKDKCDDLRSVEKVSW